MAVNKEELVQNDFIIDYGRIEDIGANIEPARIAIEYSGTAEMKRLAQKYSDGNS